MRFFQYIIIYIIRSKPDRYIPNDLIAYNKAFYQSHVRYNNIIVYATGGVTNSYEKKNVQPFYPNAPVQLLPASCCGTISPLSLEKKFVFKRELRLQRKTVAHALQASDYTKKKKKVQL